MGGRRELASEGVEMVWSLRVLSGESAGVPMGDRRRTKGVRAKVKKRAAGG